MSPNAFPHRPSCSRRGGFWVVLLSLVSLSLGGGWIVLDWHGHEHAADVEARLAAAGYAREVAGLAARPIADDDNFAATSFLTTLATSRRTPAPLAGLINGDLSDWMDKAGMFAGPADPRPQRWSDIDSSFHRLKEPKKSRLKQHLGFGSADSLSMTQALARHLEDTMGTTLVELENRLSHPQSALPVSNLVASALENRFSVHTGSGLRNLGAILFLRSEIALARGAPDRAAKSALMLWRLAEAAAGPRPHGGGVAAMDFRERAAQAHWVAARDRAWRDDDWRRIQDRCARGDPLGLARRLLLIRMMSMEEEEKTAIQQPRMRLQYTKWNDVPDRLGWSLENLSFGPIADLHYRLIGESLENLSFGESAGLLVPGGWVKGTLAAAREAAWRDLELLDRLGVSWGMTPIPAMGADGGGLRGYHGAIIQAGVPDSQTIRQSLLRSRVIDQMAMVVAALERYWLRHGGYPATLSALGPEFLSKVPMDLDGNPLRYAPDTRNGRYVLWSVGINGVDDGTWMDVRHPRRGGFNRREWPLSTDRDWVWAYP